MVTTSLIFFDPSSNGNDNTVVCFKVPYSTTWRPLVLSSDTITGPCYFFVSVPKDSEWISGYRNNPGRQSLVNEWTLEDQWSMRQTCVCMNKALCVPKSHQISETWDFLAAELRSWNMSPGQRWTGLTAHDQRKMWWCFCLTGVCERVAAWCWEEQTCTDLYNHCRCGDMKIFCLKVDLWTITIVSVITSCWSRRLEPVISVM